MLPFLKPKRIAEAVMAQPEQPEDNSTLEAANKLIEAVHAKDAQAVADILASLKGIENE